MDGGGRALRGWCNVVAGLILDLCNGKVILLGVGQFHITDRAGGLAKLPGDTFAALAAESEGPGYAVALADLGLPFRADSGEVSSEGIGGSTTLGAMDDNNRLRGKLHSRVVLHEEWVVPGFHIAEKDSGESFGGKLEGLREFGQIVGDADRASGLGNLND